MFSSFMLATSARPSASHMQQGELRARWAWQRCSLDALRQQQSSTPRRTAVVFSAQGSSDSPMKPEMWQHRNLLALFVWEQPRLLDTSASTCSKPLAPAGSAVGSHHGAPQVLKTSNDRAWATCSCAAYPNCKKYSLVSSQNYFSLLAACSCLTRKGSAHHSRQLCDQLSAAAPAGDAGSFCRQARPNKGLLNKFHEYWQWTVLFHAYFFKLSNSASMSPIPPAGQTPLRDGCAFCMERAHTDTLHLHLLWLAKEMALPLMSGYESLEKQQRDKTCLAGCFTII